MLSRYKKLTLIVSIFLILPISILIHIVFSNLTSILDHAIILNYSTTASRSYTEFSQAIEKYHVSTTSMTSRTSMREAMISFRNGDMSRSELESAIQKDYEEGVNALNNVLIAQRYWSQDFIIAEYAPDGWYAEAKPFTFDASRRDIDSEFELLYDQVLYKTALAILDDNGNILGYDYIVYDISSDFVTLSNDQMSSYLLCAYSSCFDTFLAIINNAKEVYAEDDFRILENEDTYYTLTTLPSGFYFITESGENNICQQCATSVNDLMQRTVLALAIIFGVAIMVLFFTAKKLLSKAEVTGNDFRKLAHLDTLTGCYNRTFLTFWKNGIRQANRTYYLLLLDMNDMKCINDNFGHIKGDIALQIAAEAMLESIRDCDYVIRYGGDEFVIIVDDHRETTIDRIHTSIKEHLHKAKDLQHFDIQLSLGYSLLSSDSDFDTALAEADEKMYADKKSKQTP